MGESTDSLTGAATCSERLVLEPHEQFSSSISDVCAPKHLRKKGWVVLEPLPDSTSFFDLFQEFLNTQDQGLNVSEDTQSAFRILDTQELETLPSHKSICGIMEAGKFGTISRLEHIETQEIQDRTREHVEIKPYFFRLEVRYGTNEALMLLQRTGQSGIQTALATSINSFLAAREHRFTFRLHPFTTEQSIRDALGGGIKELHFIKNKIESDIADEYNVLSDNIELLGTMALSFKTKRGAVISAERIVSKFLNSASQRSELLELYGIEFDDLKLNIKKENGQITTKSLEDVISERFATSIDISHLEMTAGLGLDLDALIDASNEHMHSLRIGIGWDV